MQCTRTVTINPDGSRNTQPKIAYDTLDEAIKAAKYVNSLPRTVTKHVAYKCKDCYKYHIGRNGKPITEKYLGHLKRNDGIVRKTFKLETTYDEELFRNHGIKREVTVRKIVSV